MQWSKTLLIEATLGIITRYVCGVGIVLHNDFFTGCNRYVYGPLRIRELQTCKRKLGQLTVTARSVATPAVTDTFAQVC